MAYGLQVYTTEGLVNIDTVFSAQIVGIVTATGSSGTINAPAAYSESTGNIHVVTNDAKIIPLLTYSSGSNLYSWSSSFNIYSENFTVYFFRVS